MAVDIGLCPLCEELEVQLEQQQERAYILKAALDRIWTNPMTADLAQQIAGTSLAEWKMKEAE